MERTPFSLLIGDFLQNARAALDYLAFELGDAGAGDGCMPEKAAAASMFPIIGDVDRDGFSGRGPDLFAQPAAQRLATVVEPARAVIEQLQPYYASGPVWRTDPLWCLNELARFDRHRFLQLVVVRTGNLELDPATTQNVRIEGELEVETGTFFADRDEHGEEVATTIARVTAHKADPRRDMELHFRGALHIAFDLDSLPSTVYQLEDSPIDLTLALIEGAVRRTLWRLAPFLPAEPPN